uniref:ZP domain-containing protein n=1 Tax=Rhabditophanes sp. KR3021 TaxID=114890 RepID=A0AC35U0I1_9BILA
MRRLAILLVIFVLKVNSLEIANEIIGVPEIQCAESAITFQIRTKVPFRGNLYIKGQFGLRNCKHTFIRNSEDIATISVRLGECGMQRAKQLQPYGINYLLIFVVNFHPQFVTMIDKAFNVRCFYAQVDTQVTSDLEVGTIPTLQLEQATSVMPNCGYSLRNGNVDGPIVKIAQVGDQLVHRWECDNPDFGMLVKNCVVSDGGSTSVKVLDGRGCPIFSPVVQGLLTYSSDLKMAFVPVWAYKFQDRSQLFFQCQIQVCNKRDNACLGITPPNCPIVNPQDFVPNAFIDINRDPEKVVGTFREDAQMKKKFLDSETHITPRKKIFVHTASQNVKQDGEPTLYKHIVEQPLKRIIANETAKFSIRNDSMTPVDAFINKTTSIKPKSVHLLAERLRLSRVKKDVKRIIHPASQESRFSSDSTMDVLAEPLIISDPEANRNSTPNYDFNNTNTEWCIHRYLLIFLGLLISMLTVLLIALSISVCFLFQKLEKGTDVTKGFYRCDDFELLNTQSFKASSSKRSLTSDNKLKKFDTRGLSADSFNKY